MQRLIGEFHQRRVVGHRHHYRIHQRYHIGGGEAREPGARQIGGDGIERRHRRAAGKVVGRRQAAAGPQRVEMPGSGASTIPATSASADCAAGSGERASVLARSASSGCRRLRVGSSSGRIAGLSPTAAKAARSMVSNPAGVTTSPSLILA